MNRKITAIILAAAMTLTGGVMPFGAPVNCMAVSSSEAPEVLTGILPASYSEAEEFRAENGSVSVHEGYIVYCDIENHSTAFDLFLFTDGESDLKEITDLRFTEEEPSPPGSPSFVIRIYEPKRAGKLKCYWSQRHLYDDSAPVLNEVTKYFEVDDTLMIAEITEEDYGDLTHSGKLEWTSGDGRVEFTNTAFNGELELIVSTNQDYDVAYNGETAVFTPKGDGRYVLTAAVIYNDYYAIDGEEIRYYYPVLKNFVVDISGGELVCESYGECDRFSEKDLKAENADSKNEIRSEYCDISGDGSYYAFVNGHIPKDEERCYISDIWTAEGVQVSCFCVNEQYTGREREAGISGSAAEFSGILRTSSGNSGDLMAATPDMVEQYRFRALSDGITTAYVDDRSFDLTVSGGRFSRRAAVQIPEAVMQLLPRTVSRFNAYRAQYGTVSEQSGFIIYCDDVDSDLRLTQEGSGRLTAVMEYTIDSEDGSDHRVIVYTPTEPGKVRAVWEQGSSADWENTRTQRAVKYYEIDEKLNVREITETEFCGGVPGDVNGDGKLTIADLTLVERWLLGTGEELRCWENADLCKDGRIDVYDYCLMKKLFVGQEAR